MPKGSYERKRLPDRVASGERHWATTKSEEFYTKVTMAPRSKKGSDV